MIKFDELQAVDKLEAAFCNLELFDARIVIEFTFLPFIEY